MFDLRTSGWWQRPVQAGPAVMVTSLIAVGAIIGVGTVAYVAHNIITANSAKSAIRNGQFCDVAGAVRALEPYVPPVAREPFDKVKADTEMDPDCHVKSAATGTSQVPKSHTRRVVKVKPGPTKSVFVPFPFRVTPTPAPTHHRKVSKPHHHHKKHPTPNPSTCIQSTKICLPPLGSMATSTHPFHRSHS